MEDVFKNGVKSIFEAAKNIATGVDQYVSTNTEIERKEICKACPKLMVTRQCGECLCFIDFKTKLKQEKCPLGKWDKEE